MLSGLRMSAQNSYPKVQAMKYGIYYASIPSFAQEGDRW